MEKGSNLHIRVIDYANSALENDNKKTAILQFKSFPRNM